MNADLVEAVARALCISRGENPNHIHDRGVAAWVAHAKDARVALEVIERERQAQENSKGKAA